MQESFLNHGADVENRTTESRSYSLLSILVSGDLAPLHRKLPRSNSSKASEELAIGNCRFTTFDLGGHQQGIAQFPRCSRKISFMLGDSG